jgi:hypothetical protein
MKKEITFFNFWNMQQTPTQVNKQHQQTPSGK